MTTSLLVATLLCSVAAAADVETTVQVISSGKGIEQNWPGLGWLVGPRPSRLTLYAVMLPELVGLTIWQYFAGPSVMIVRFISMIFHLAAAFNNSRL